MAKRETVDGNQIGGGVELHRSNGAAALDQANSPHAPERDAMPSDRGGGVDRIADALRGQSARARALPVLAPLRKSESTGRQAEAVETPVL